MPVNWGIQGQGFNALEALQTFGQAQQQGMQRQNMALKQQEMQAQVAARQMASQQLGAGDFAGAANTAAAGGDYDFAKFASSASDDHRKQLAEQAGLIGSLAVRLKGQPPEARAQAFAALAPQLAQRGFDQNELANVDLSDVGLDNYIAMATSADDALKAYAKSQQPFELSAGQARYSADGQVIAQNAPLPKWQFDSESGSWLQEPGSGPAGYAAPQASQAQPGGGGTFQRMIGAESGGRQFARNGQPLTSSAGAVGMAQVMPSTGPEAAKAAGLPWDPDRFRNDPEYNSRLGNAYYQKQLQAFNGDEAKAVAAYNAGPGRIRQAVLRSGDAWQESIPSETQGYLRKVLGGGQGGAPGVVNVRPPKTREPKERYRMLSRAEAQAQGLDTNTRWQVSPQGQVAALPSRGDKPLTEAQAKAGGYLEAAVAAQNSLNQVSGYKPSIVSTALADVSAGNPVRQNLSQVDRRVIAAQLAFATAILRQESGAAISQTEAAQRARILFPEPGDGPEVQADKRTQREAALRALRFASGPAGANVGRVKANPYDTKQPGGARQRYTPPVVGKAGQGRISPTIRRIN